MTIAAIATSALLLGVAAGCGGDDDADPSAPPVPTPPPSPSATTSPGGSGPETTAPATTEPATTDAEPGSTSPVTGPQVTATMPPVTTLVPQVPDESLTEAQRDPFAVDNSRPVLPEHVPVIEAHVAANQAFLAVASRSPVDPLAAELAGAPFTPESLAANQRFLQDRAAAGQVLDVSQGSTNRPYIIGPVGDTATVFDCGIDGVYWTGPDGPIAPTEVWPAAPGSIVEVGVRIDMVRRDGRWLVDTSEIDQGACG